MDTEMRELERLASTGDSRAQRKLDLMRSALSRARRFADLNIESMPRQEINIDERIKPYLHEAPA